MRAKYITGFILLAGMTGGLAFWSNNVPEIDQMPLENDNWKLLEIPKPPNVQSLSSQLRRLKPWEEKEETTSAKSTQKSSKSKSGSKPLKLVGIVQRGHNDYILVMDNKNKVVSYDLNSELPNGTKLHAIHDDHIKVKDFSEIEVIKLYDQE
jgi:hypothetical protein